MLLRNDIFTFEQQRYRVLYTHPQQQVVWVIALDDANAWPIELPSAIAHDVSPDDSDTVAPVLNPSTAMLTKRNDAYERIRPLVTSVPHIYDAARRGPLVERRAADFGCSKRTLYKDLRRWFQGGQTPDALLGRYQNSGRRETANTGNRGRKPVPRHDGPADLEEVAFGYDTYQLSEEDLLLFRKHIEKTGGYLKDPRVTQASAYQRLLEEHYTARDGNGDRYIRQVGSRPTYRQFTHFLRKHYSLEARLRSRKGDKDFALENAAKIGSVIGDCRGVGHYYEIDATIVDINVVSKSDVKSIIGKPTLYLIIDRKSRLIVGFYCGLENASWMGAMQAILSIATDKRALCDRYGVKYNPEDWPADRVFPREFLADRGEMLHSNSNNVCDGLAITVTNLPSRMAKWKPVVECGFKLTHESLADVAPSYNPVFNAAKRQGKHFDKDACLTLDEFVGIMLRTIITHNRKAMPKYPLNLEELTAGTQPIPIHLWNHDVPKSAGNLTRYSDAQVRQALLPKEKAVITDKGILFRDCYYTCAEAEARGWFVLARNKSQSEVTVSFDYRLADCILVRSPHDRQAVLEAHLTTRSERFRGLSFAEVKYYIELQKQMLPANVQNRMQTMYEYHQDVDPVVEHAKKRLKLLGPGISRSSRRADVKPARHIARQEERAELAQLHQAIVPVVPKDSATTLAPQPPSTRDRSTLSLVQSGSNTSPNSSPAKSPAQRAQELRKKMLNDYQ